MPFKLCATGFLVSLKIDIPPPRQFIAPDLFLMTTVTTSRAILHLSVLIAGVCNGRSISVNQK